MRLLALLPLLAIVLVAGCVGQAPSTNTETSGGAIVPGIKEFHVTIFHTGYQPSIFTVDKGDTARFLVKVAPGTESHMHGITIDEYGINEASASSTQEKAIEFVADKAGTFTIYCKTCWDGLFGRGHPNIQATLTVNE